MIVVGYWRQAFAGILLTYDSVRPDSF